MKKRILVVDDNDFARETTADMVEHFGWDVDEAANGLQALAILRANSFDLVLMDCEMPGMDGLETTRIALEQAGDDPPVVVAITAHQGNDHVQACRAAGMREHLGKPFSLKLLGELLSRYDRENAPLKGA
jgi:CheY-like chemotaxis protein